MKKEKLNISKSLEDDDFYTATYSADEGNEAHHLAYQGRLSDAIADALNIWGLSEDDVYIEASN